MVAATVLPNLFVIGAPKCGTTSFHHYLGLHPEISMSTVKEPWLFAGDGYPGSLQGYADLLDPDAEVRGESSAIYSQHPTWPGIPERIVERVPEARFIYLVRDPIDRAVAHYRNHVRDGKESRPIEIALADHRAPDNVYIAASRYASQLERYLRYFDRSRFLVLEQAELGGDRERTLERAFRFLSVDPTFRSPGFAEQLNTREDLRRPTRVGAALERVGVTPMARRAPLPRAARRLLRRVVSRASPNAALPATLRQELARSLSDEMAAFRELTGLSLSSLLSDQRAQGRTSRRPVG